jgi:crotonobetainyl-CoA:carnitine CoA-transferase CaiB-like acyl-CoA transferase
MLEFLQNLFRSKSRQEWVEFFAADDICFTPVLSLNEVIEHPQVQDRRMLIALNNFLGSGQNLIIPGIPIKLSDTPGQITTRFARLGENTDEILVSLGYDENSITAFKAQNIVK